MPGECLLGYLKLKTAMEYLRRLMHCNFVLHDECTTVDFLTLCMCMVSYCIVCLVLPFILMALLVPGCAHSAIPSEL